MIREMKRSADLARLRSLAAMGLPGEMFIPALLEALHDIIPSDRNLFDWTDSTGQLVRYYFEGPIDHAINAHYFEMFHNRRESEVMPSFKEAVTGRSVIHSAEELDRPAFFRSALYNEIWRPQRLHTRTEAIVRGVRGQPLGSLVLYRGPGQRKFTRAEEVLLARIVPYVSRGLEAPSAELGGMEYVVNRDRRAVLCLGAGGDVMHLSPDALKILLLSHGGVTPERASRAPRRDDFPTLTALWQHHADAELLSQPDVALTVENAWGRFVYESRVLFPLNRADDQVVHITIEHQEPKALAVRRVLDTLSITPTQKEVCLLLRTGYSQAEIAKLMAISASTVSDHVKKIYSRLGVHSVHELTNLIQQAA